MNLRNNATNNWKSQNKKIDRKSGDTTVRMTADEMFGLTNPISFSD